MLSSPCMRLFAVFHFAFLRNFVAFARAFSVLYSPAVTPLRCSGAMYAATSVVMLMVHVVSLLVPRPQQVRNPRPCEVGPDPSDTRASKCLHD